MELWFVLYLLYFEVGVEHRLRIGRTNREHLVGFETNMHVGDGIILFEPGVYSIWGCG